MSLPEIALRYWWAYALVVAVFMTGSALTRRLGWSPWKWATLVLTGYACLLHSLLFVRDETRDRQIEREVIERVLHQIQDIRRQDQESVLEQCRGMVWFKWPWPDVE